jgi:hypothetical protein
MADEEYFKGWKHKALLFDKTRNKSKKRTLKLGKSKPVSVMVDVDLDEKQQRELADQLLAWIRETKPSDIREFFWDRKISFYSFKKQAKRVPYLEEALILAGEIISGKITNEWLHNEVNGSAAHRILWQIDRGYKESAAEEKALTTQPAVQEDIKFIFDAKE